jgi:hypothetical protein
VIEEHYEMKIWNLARWQRLLGQTSFELSAAYEPGSFSPLSVDEGLNGERLFWQQLVKLH